MSKQNVDLVKGLVETVNASEMEPQLSLLHPDVVWESRTGLVELQGTYRGHDEVRRFLEEGMESFVSLNVRAEEIIDFEDTVIVGADITAVGEASGAEVTMRAWYVSRFRDHLVVSVDFVGTKAEALETAGVTP